MRTNYCNEFPCLRIFFLFSILFLFRLCMHTCNSLTIVEPQQSFENTKECTTAGICLFLFWYSIVAISVCLVDYILSCLNRIIFCRVWIGYKNSQKIGKYNLEIHFISCFEFIFTFKKIIKSIIKTCENNKKILNIYTK